MMTSQWSKFEEFPGNKIHVYHILKFVLGRVENFVGNGENAGYLHFLLHINFSEWFFFKAVKSTTMFSKSFFVMFIKNQDWVGKG